MHRFFVAPELVQQSGALITLPAELAHQLRDVLHLQVDEQIALLDNSGDEILAAIATVSKSAVHVRLLERRAGKSESHVRIILCQGLLKSARFEWVLEKGTELGVFVFSPVLCRRSLAGLEDAGTSKTQRWQRIITEAAEQSGRARLPALLPIRSLKDALDDIPPGALALMPWEEEHALTLRDALRNIVLSRGGGGVDEGWGPLRSPSSQQVGDENFEPLRSPSFSKSLTQTGTTITVVLFIGPEGGLTEEEVKQAHQRGAQIVSLGPRILRAETAALAAVANVMYELER
jgi:16S rRNA (uracil1498-N3)-methyltransferase